MIPIHNSIVPQQSKIPILNELERIHTRSQNLTHSEVLGRHDRIRRVVEAGPDIIGAVTEDKVAGVVEQGGGDAAAGGVGVPDGAVGAVDEAEGAGGEEVEGAGGVNGAGGPDGKGAGVGDGGEERRG